MKEVTINKKEEEKIKSNSTKKNGDDGVKLTHSQPQDESKNLVSKWNTSKPPQTASSESGTVKEYPTILIPLPEGASLTIRLSEELRKAEDGESPYRIVYKFPAPKESTELVASDSTVPSASQPQSQASSEAKQKTRNESVEEKAVLPEWAASRATYASVESMLRTLDQCQWLLSIKRLITALSLSLPSCSARTHVQHTSSLSDALMYKI